MRADIFHPDFKAQPWWWEAWTPNNALSQDPPARTDIVIVGAGYGGLSTALELRRNGVGAVVLERGDFGVGAWTRKHYADLATKVETYNKYANAGSSMVPRERQREMIASDYYYGGMHATRAGHLHPALYYKGLLEAAHRAGAILCANVEAERIEKTASGWRVLTSKGPVECREVVVATNGYTGDLTPRLKRRVVPVASHIIATEELPEHASSLIPELRAVGDTKRVLTYYRPSPDGKRLIFGGRARFTAAPPEVSAPALYRYMIDR